ncbi:protein phosphatase 2C domain-containing protein [Alkalihalophilus sp. As8PL]|uniref:Protein phosphatase 2C domain-containing protein n=1 Tax=Alkalihalophilus sp. As8PL TaxID=3237103 RepID=A0AB39BWX8_9BACI
MSKAVKNNDYCWVGSQKNFVDEINIHKISHMVLGRFGGNSSAGQYKNEDGCIVWVNDDLNYEFVVLLDAHQTAESAELVVSTIQSLKEDIKSILTHSPRKSFDCLYKLLLRTFESKGFKEACKKVQGETAFLCAVRKDKFLWWFSVGDCILYLNHPELSNLSEYQQNHRSFYEWIGKVNTFELEVPCFSIGTKELRQGRNHIFLTTDGLVECPNVDFANPRKIFNSIYEFTNEESVWRLLKEIQKNNVRDSTTIVSWFVEIDIEGSQPSK